MISLILSLPVCDILIRNWMLILMKARGNVCTVCFISYRGKKMFFTSMSSHIEQLCTFLFNQHFTFILFHTKASSKYLFRNFFPPSVSHSILTNVIYDPFTHAHIQSSVLNLFFTCVCSLLKRASPSLFQVCYTETHKKKFY